MGSNNNQNQQQQKPATSFQGMPSTVTPFGGASSMPPTNLSLTGSPMNSSQNFVQNQTNRYQQQQGPLVNQAAQNYANASVTQPADYNNIMATYQNRYGLGGGSTGGGATSGGGGALNTRLPGESSYQWTQRVANATGRTDIANDPAALQYWADSINSKPQSGDMGYWIDKFTQGGGGGGGGGGFSGGGYSGLYQSGLSQAPGAAQAGYSSAGPAAQASAERVAASRMLDSSAYGHVTPSDPFNSYAGYTEFSNTGGYSPADIANMRARGVAPIRAAYANAERNVGQQRALQGGYSPNAVAAQVKMAREQGQGMADASTNLEAQLAQMKQAGRLQGLGGMSDIEKQRLQAQMQGDIFNAGQRMQGQQFDIGNENAINQFNAGQGNQVGMFNAGQTNQQGQFNAGQANQVGMYNAGQTNDVNMFNTGQANQVGMFNAGQGNQVGMYNAGLGMQGLQGMSSLYGTTPGMASTFGSQAEGFLNSGGQQGLGAMGAFNTANQLPDAYSQNMGRINQGMNTAGTIAQGIGTGINAYQNRPGNQYVNYGASGVGGGYPNTWGSDLPQTSIGSYGNPYTPPAGGGYFSQPPPVQTDVMRYPNSAYYS